MYRNKTKTIYSILAMFCVASLAWGAPTRLPGDYVEFREGSITPPAKSGHTNMFVESDGKVKISDDMGNKYQVHSGTEDLGSSLFNGTIDVPKGGTGRSTISPDALMYGNGTGNVALLAVGTSNQFVKGGIAPTYGSVLLNTADVSGVLPIANGGTGQSTQTNAFDALSPNTTKGDITAHNGTDNVRLPVGGTNGFVLSVDSAETTGLKWVSPDSGGGGGGGALDSFHWVQTPGGYGSVGNKIVYFTVVQDSAGADITYTSSTSSGDFWTINTAGTYCVYYAFATQNTGRRGITLNASSLTVSPTALAISQQLSAFQAVSTQGTATNTPCKPLVPGDIVRLQTDGGAVLPEAWEGVIVTRVN